MGAARSSDGVRNSFLAYLEARVDAAFVAAKSSEGHAWVQGGNSFGAVGVLGTNDANPLQIRTSGTTRGTFDTSGNLSLTGSFLAAAGQGLDTSAAGSLAIGGTTATSITMGGAGRPAFTATTGTVSWTSNGAGTLSFSANFNLDVPTATNLNIGGTNAGELINIGLPSSTLTIASATYSIRGSATFADANNNTWLQNTPVASAVNFVKIANAATTTAPTVSSAGTDTNIGLTLLSKGTGVVAAQPGTDSISAFGLLTAGGAGTQYFRGDSTNSRVGVGPVMAAPATTLHVLSAGAQLVATGQNFIALFANNANNATAGCVSFWGGDNSGTSRIICDFREFGASGTIVGSIAITTGATAFNTSSDRRLKKDIEDTKRGLADVLRIRIRDFGFKVDADGTAKRMGVIAQEIQEVFPECVTVEAQGAKYMQVDYSKLTPLCVKAIQELEARIVSLEARLVA